MSCLVFLSFCFGTFRYSHDRIAKKKAPIVNCVMAFCVSVVVLSAMMERMHIGIAFSGISRGSAFLYARYCRAKIQARFPSLSSVGFRKPFRLKTAAT